MDPLDKVTIEQRLAAIEDKLDAVLGRLGMVAETDVFGPREAEPMPEVAELVRQGKLIHAIKIYRQATGASLREAKEEIDRIAAGVRGH
jgi:ribosomal protein L7/L12